MTIIEARQRCAAMGITDVRIVRCIVTSFDDDTYAATSETWRIVGLMHKPWLTEVSELARSLDAAVAQLERRYL